VGLAAEINKSNQSNQAGSWVPTHGDP